MSSNGQEDHVSMGANGALKTLKIIDNIEKVLAIELLTSSQAIYTLETKSFVYKLSKYIGDFLDNYRKVVKPIVKDKVLHGSIERSISFIKECNFLK